MSHHIVGFAEKLFATNPRPSSLSIEKVISNIVLFNIIVQIILIGYILIDDFVCIEAHVNIIEALNSKIPAKAGVEEYLGQVCGTEIRSKIYWFYVEKIVFLFFFLAIFYINKSFISRINRYHVIVMREKISHFLSNAPVYKNVNYEKRWQFTVGVYIIFKIISTLFLILLIVAAFLILNEISEIKELLAFEGEHCGPKMKFVDDIDVELICHFEHEFLIRVLSYITNILALIIVILYFISIFCVIFYVRKFKKQKRRDVELDMHMISYKKLHDDSSRELQSFDGEHSH